jgi:hypothetical protein
MMKQIFILSILVLLLAQCTVPTSNNHKSFALNKQLPRVLFITTGISDEGGQLAQGVVVAVQSFNKKGATVRLEPRDVLYDFEELTKYNIIVLSTFPGYHDADRKYSLSYMSDEEIHNLTSFVQQGGVIISGDNVGRNFPDGTDRIIVFQQLNPDNWELSKCYGLSLSEKNMTDYQSEGEIPNYSKWAINIGSLIEKDAELWTLVPDSVFSDNLKILGYWKNKTDSIPAFIENKYGNGMAYLMSSSSFIHPVNDGGYWSVDQIENFYNYVIDEYNKINGINVTLNPWPGAYDYAFCVTLNSEGVTDQYKRVFQLLDEEDIKPTIFVNGLVNDSLRSFLKSTNYYLESSGFAYRDFVGLMYPQSLDDILRNENNWDIDFQGFRFPYTKPGFWGLLTLDKYDYSFESSIGVNNLDFIHGSVFPYNVVIANDRFYKSTNILEIAPTYHDDYYFLKAIKENNGTNPERLKKSVMIYSKYLANFWDYAVKPNHGLMVFLGHPQYVGYNDTTLTSLVNLITKVKQDNTWITTINDVAVFRNNLGNLQFFIENEGKKQLIEVVAPASVKVENVCLNFTGKVKSAKVKEGKIKIVENAKGFQLIFNAFDGQRLTIKYF